MNNGLMVVNPDGTILMVNQAFEKIMGYRREEVIGALLRYVAVAMPVKPLRSDGKGSWCDLFDLGSATRKPCL